MAIFLTNVEARALLPFPLQVEIDWDQIGAKIEDEFQKEKEAGKRS